MWLMKSPPMYCENGFWKEHHWANHLALVSKHYWWKYFESKNFKDLTPEWMRNIQVDLTGDRKRLLVIRPGGFGDLLMMTAALKVIKKRFPRLIICFAGLNEKVGILKDNTEIKTFLGTPMHQIGSLVEDYDDVWDYTGVVAAHPRAQVMNAYEQYIRYTIPDVSEEEVKDARPMINLAPDEEMVYEQKFSRLGLKPDDKYVVISMESTSLLRNWEVSKWYELTKRLAENLPEHKIVLVGIANYILRSVVYKCEKCGKEDLLRVANKDSLIEPLKIKCKECGAPIHYYNEEPEAKDADVQTIWPFRSERVHAFLGKEFDIREVAYLVKFADLLIGPDTGTSHMAAAFKTPQLTLFSAFEGDLRLRYFEEASWIQHPFSCAPCFLHSLVCPYNSKMDEDGAAACMKSLPVDEVYEKALAILRTEARFRPEPAKLGFGLETHCSYVCGGKSKFICRKGCSLYYKCDDCGTIFTPNPPADVKPLYDQADYSKIFRRETLRDGNRSLALRISSKAPGVKKGFNTWLDVGCSVGSLLEGAEMLGWEVEGVEISKDSWQEAQKKFGDRVKNASLKDYKTDRKFGIITCHHTLEHVPDQFEALAKLASLLEPDGLLSINGPCADLWCGNNFWGHLNTYFAGEHICIQSRAAFDILAGKAGLEILEYRFYSGSGDFESFLRKRPMRRARCQN